MVLDRDSGDERREGRAVQELQRVKVNFVSTFVSEKSENRCERNAEGGPRGDSILPPRDLDRTLINTCV